MFGKWIVCEVRENLKEEFSAAQQKWDAVKKCKGFITQLGGWDSESGKACILGIWEDENYYNNFMNSLHDIITEENKQEKTYEKISVNLLRSIFEMPGYETSFLKSFKSYSVLRAADCIVKKEQVVNFKKVQKEIWAAEMSLCKGMNGGFSWEVKTTSDNNSRFLVTTLWENKQLHQEYINDKLPYLREKMKVTEKVDSIIGYCIDLENKWLV